MRMLDVMQNMLSHYHGNAADRDVIAEALSAMRKVTQSINELKREHERSVRAVEIQRLLDGWSSIDLALLGQLIMEVVTLVILDPVTRLKLSMGPIRGPYSLYRRHVRASMLPKKETKLSLIHI